MKNSALLFLAIIILTACRKESDRDLDRSITESADFVYSEFVFSDISGIVREAIELEDGLRAGSSLLNCANIMIDTLSNPMWMLIDFGPTNCTGSDGRNRRGKLFATFTMPFRDSLSETTIYPQDYFLNDRKIEGSKTLYNRGRNSAGNLHFSANVSNGKISDADSSRFMLISSFTFEEWLSGENTPLITDDLIRITGYANGTGRFGNTYDASISSPLVLNLSCNQVTSGVAEVIPENLNARELNYGSGACDGLVKISVNGFEEEITIDP